MKYRNLSFSRLLNISLVLGIVGEALSIFFMTLVTPYNLFLSNVPSDGTDD